ncbi:MAG TPA: peptide-methionine (S)-S-oxide reductase MsrA, partial [Longimicrobiales bacterium]
RLRTGERTDPGAAGAEPDGALRDFTFGTIATPRPGVAMSRLAVHSAAALLITLAAACTANRGDPPRDTVPPATAYAQPTAPGREEVAVLAGGCFWGVEAVFEHVKGVIDVVSGYAGGSVRNPSYAQVSSGTTGHAEAVRIVFDPSQISYRELLRIFFSVAHDPTQLNRQGPDIGPQYRSAIFYANEAQARVARETIAQLARDHVFPRRIVTQVVPLDAFFQAEAYHQDYMAHHPNQLYIVINDRPKLKHLRERFPELYREPEQGRGRG